MSYTTLYGIWGAMYALTALLGLTSPQGLMVYGYQLLAVAFFLPPWLILKKAKAQGQVFHKRLIAIFALVWLAVAVAMMVLNIRSAMWSQAAGNALHAATAIVTAPLLCGQAPLLSLFLWAVLLMAALRKKP